METKPVIIWVSIKATLKKITMPSNEAVYCRRRIKKLGSSFGRD